MSSKEWSEYVKLTAESVTEPVGWSRVGKDCVCLSACICLSVGLSVSTCACVHVCVCLCVRVC